MLYITWCAWHPMYRRKRRLLRVRILRPWQRWNCIVSHGICRACLERTLLAARGRRGTR